MPPHNFDSPQCLQLTGLVHLNFLPNLKICLISALTLIINHTRFRDENPSLKRAKNLLDSRPLHFS